MKGIQRLDAEMSVAPWEGDWCCHSAWVGGRYLLFLQSLLRNKH